MQPPDANFKQLDYELEISIARKLTRAPCAVRIHHTTMQQCKGAVAPLTTTYYYATH